jgi:hypothetical protein
MKTPLKTAIDRLKDKKAKYGFDKLWNLEQMNEINKSIALLESLLPDERETILSAFVAGDQRGTNDIPFNAEQYYSQTFDQ